MCLQILPGPFPIQQYCNRIRGNRALGDHSFYNTISPTEKDMVGKLMNNKYL